MRRANRFLLRRCLRKGGAPLFLVHLPCARALIVSQGDESVHGRTRRERGRYRAVSVEFLKNRRTDEVLGGALENALHLVAYELPESG